MSSSGPPSTLRTRLVVAGLTDVGRQRKHNEDCILVRPEHGLFVVADGMGGHNAGDVASKLVATSLGNFFEATESGASIGELPDEYAGLGTDGRRLAAAVRKANHDVFTISNTHQQHHGMGSTVVAIYLVNEVVHIAHVGDSRCYRIRDGEIAQLTRDHSLINDALEMKPDLTKEELARLPKNIITRALGMKDGVKVDIKSEPVLPGDVLLLCSDGLTGMVPPEQILEVLTLTHEPEEACELLVAEANDAGGTDNISALVVRVEEVIDDEDADPGDLDPEGAFEIQGDAADEPLDTPDSPDAPDIAARAEQDDDIDDEDATPAMFAAVAVEAAPRSSGSPTLEIVSEDDPDEPGLLEEGDVAGAIAAFMRGDEIDLEMRGPWPGRMRVPRCTRCDHQLFPGNLFCVECGARIESVMA